MRRFGLIAANLVWAAACFRWAVLLRGTASGLGLAHFILEGLFVGTLACVEWRFRARLVDRADQAQAD